MKTKTPEHCPYCEYEWQDSCSSYLLLDIKTHELDAYVTLQACCQVAQEVISEEGYESLTGRAVIDVVIEFTGFDVLEISGELASTLVCRLQMVDPTELSSKTDKYGNHLTSSPAGWQRDIFSSVNKYHRHHTAPQGWKFGLACYNGRVRVGVATVGRPVSRMLDDGTALEVTRVCTMATQPLRFNASSKLYAAAASRARSLGYSRLITYTLCGIESGGSLRAAGWIPTLVSEGGSWSRADRGREDKAPTTPKVKWERGLTKKVKREILTREVKT